MRHIIPLAGLLMLCSIPSQAFAPPVLELDQRNVAWMAAEALLENRPAGTVRVGIFPDSEGGVGDLQVIDLTYEISDGEPVTQWTAGRVRIDSGELGRVPADATPPDYTASILVSEVAEAESCPGVVEHLQALEALLVQSFDLPGFGEDVEPGPWRIHADGLELQVQGTFRADRDLGSVRYEFGDTHPLGHWTRGFVAKLEPCWHPDPDAAG